MTYSYTYTYYYILTLKNNDASTKGSQGSAVSNGTKSHIQDLIDQRAADNLAKLEVG